MLYSIQVAHAKCATGDNIGIAMNAILRDGIRIGGNSMIGMGAAVTKDVPEHVVVCGCPAKVVRENS